MKNRTGEEKQDTIRLHLLKRNSSQVVSTHKAPSQFKGTNGKTKKKHHARLPAQVPAFSVSRSPSGNNRHDRKDKVSAKKTGNIPEDYREGKRKHKKENSAVLRNVWKQKAMVPGKVRTHCFIARLARRREGLGEQRLADFTILPHGVRWRFRA